MSPNPFRCFFYQKGRRQNAGKEADKNEKLRKSNYSQLTKYAELSSVLEGELLPQKLILDIIRNSSLNPFYQKAQTLIKTRTNEVY